MKINASVAIPTRLKRTLAIAVAGSLLLFLSGCGIPRLRGSKPAPCEPGTFNGVTTPDNSSQIPIADFFQDPQLMGLIDQALWGNQDLRILSEAIEIANNEIRRRRGAYLPFVGGQASAGLDKLSTYTPGDPTSVRSRHPRADPSPIRCQTFSWPGTSPGRSTSGANCATRETWRA